MDIGFLIHFLSPWWVSRNMGWCLAHSQIFTPASQCNTRGRAMMMHVSKNYFSTIVASSQSQVNCVRIFFSFKLNKFNIKISPACWQTETGAKTWPLDFLQPEFCCLTEVEYWSDLAGFIIKPNQETSDERGSKMSIIQINQCLERTKQQRNSNKRRYSSCFGETNNN